VIERITAIVRADFLIRFRRLSTVIIFLLLSGFAYVWIPAPATGRTLMQINGARVLYNSAAIGIGTSMLASIFIGLFGFYVISNAVRRDIDSRCGYVIASTTMRTGEYVIGKFLGNVVFLSTFVGGYMAVSMVMQLVRGEAPLEPLVFLQQYALMTPATIVFVSVAAIVFESIPFLSGRFGDVLYFILYAVSLGFVGSTMEHAGSESMARYFDISGFGFMFEQTRRTFHTTSMSIGSSSFNPAIRPLLIGGLELSGRDWLTRIVSTLVSTPLLLLAWLFFHRFDPARLRAAGAKGKRGWLRQFSALAKPLVRPFALIPVRGAAFKDAMMTFSMTPFAGLALIGITIAALANPKSLPVTFALAAVFIADVASRDRRAATTGLISAAPRLRERFVTWKLASAVIVALLLLIAPVVRAALHPAALLPLLTGILFIAAAATALGVISGNPKTFIVLFLTFWYVVVNDKGATKALDFAGFFSTPAMTVMLMYLAIAIVMLATAEGVHRARLRA